MYAYFEISVRLFFFFSNTDSVLSLALDSCCLFTFGVAAEVGESVYDFVCEKFYKTSNTSSY